MGAPGKGSWPTRGLVDVGRPSGLLPECDAVGGGQLPRFVVVDVRSRSCVHEQSLEPWAATGFGNVSGSADALRSWQDAEMCPTLIKRACVL